MNDPAFLFYDGDAARDVSHMSRLERGCYFDLIQAQRKFGGYTVEQARKILGKDFEECWPSIELVLLSENDKYYIGWVRDSIEKRKQHAEKQRKRIQDYWDEKKKEEEERLIHGNTVVLPLENENENENEIKSNKGAKKPKTFVPPTCQEVKDYFVSFGYLPDVGERAYNWYASADWHDAKGNKVKNWKQKMQRWFTPENKKQSEIIPTYKAPPSR